MAAAWRRPSARPLHPAASGLCCLLTLPAASRSSWPPPPAPQVLFGGFPEVAEEGPSRYGPNAAGWVRVDERWTLAECLGRPDHVVPGIPVFFVLARRSPMRQQFLENDVPLL